MANKKLFGSNQVVTGPRATVKNEAGGQAYALSPKHILTQYAAAGFLGGSYYASAQAELNTIMQLCEDVEPSYIAKLAVYCRRDGYMKDTPALLAAALASRGPEGLAALEKVFPQVIDNAKMLRNFVQIVRSGVTGRKSFGTALKRMICNWLDQKHDAVIFRGTVGKDPSMADIIKMVHPKPKTEEREALYGYILGRQHDESKLPQIVKDFEAFKNDPDNITPPRVDFRQITGVPELPDRLWKQFAKDGGWHMVRMNLNSFQRHGVLEDTEMVDIIAEKLADPEQIKYAKVFPYQLLAAYMHTSISMPIAIREALKDALDIACKNIPEFNGKVHVCPDISGSMGSPVSGLNGGRPSMVTCKDVAALVSSAILKKNPSAEVLPFHSQCVNIQLDADNSVMLNANILMRAPGGSTDCSAPLRELNKSQATGDLVIYVSDNQSWVSENGFYRQQPYTNTLEEWSIYKQRNPNARLVCIDIHAGGSTQAPEGKDILNIGGFSDNVFKVIKDFADGKLDKGGFVEAVDKIDLDNL